MLSENMAVSAVPIKLSEKQPNLLSLVNDDQEQSKQLYHNLVLFCHVT